MARNVRIASLALDPRPIGRKKPGQSTAEMMRNWLRRNIDQVMPDRPDLIVLPEACDRPSSITDEEFAQYYEERGSLVLDAVRSVARENHCCIAYGVARTAEDNEGEGRTILDVIKEFEIETADEYFARSRAHREQYWPKA